MTRFACPQLVATATGAAAERAPEDPVVAVGVALVAVLATLGVANLLGLLDASRWRAARRVPAGRPLGPLVGVMFAAVVVWAAGPTLFLWRSPATPGQPVTATGPGAPALSAFQVVAIGVTVPAVAFVVLMAGNALVRPRVGQRLGFELRRAPRALVAGVAGLLLALPIVYGAMRLSEVVYRWAGYTHPPEHDLLRLMDEAGDPLVKYLAIVAAVVVAPLWEELLFRGHVQTLIREGLIRMGERLLRLDADDLESGAPAADADAERRARPLESWAAVVLASLLFAGVHQPWTWPAIFVLSICLGLAYERTGTVWVPIVMHAGFNALMTTLFLFGPRLD
jgi:membrane protease YdiL (CAAX protease family)